MQTSRLFSLLCVGLSLSLSSFSIGAGEINDRSGKKNRPVISPPPEELDDLPDPTAAARPALESARGIYHRGPFTSIQVNVNGAGNNIVGDAANEPSMTISKVDPTKIAITWRQFDTISNNFRQAGRAYSTNAGATWTFPGSLDPGQFRSDPVLDSDAAGSFYFSSLSSTTSVEMFKSTDGGITWGPEVPAFGGDKQWIAVDDRPVGQLGAGHIYQHWNVQFTCCQPNDYTRSINGAASFQAPRAIPLPSMKWGVSDVGPDGTLYIAGSNLNQTGHLIARSTNAKDPGMLPTFDFVNSVNLGGVTGGFGNADPNPGGLLGQVSVWADPSNEKRIYMLGSVSPSFGNPMDVNFVRSVNTGQSWSAPVTVNDDGFNEAFHWFGTMSVAPNGRIDAVWNDTRNTGSFRLSETFYSYSLDTGYTWSPSVAVSPVWDSYLGWPNQQKIGDYYHMHSDNAGASLAYSATFNGEQDVYFLRMMADCNGNAIADPQDVLNGAPDCNANEVPDSCERMADCNGNSIQDICDIAAGTSDDCNFTLIPDECEGSADCNANSISDFCDIEAGTSADCNTNQIPDECDIADMTSQDVDGDLIPDECEGACCLMNNDCELTTFAQCSGQSGNFQGLGMNCDSVACGPPNDDCENAELLPLSHAASVSFDNRTAFLDGPSPVNCNGQNFSVGADLWFEYVAPCSGTVTFSLCGGTSFDSVLLIYGGNSATCACPPAGAQISCDDDGCGSGGGPSRITRSVVGGNCYLIRVAGWTTSTGTGALNVSYNTACNLSPLPLADPSGIRKNRYLSFSIPPTNAFNPNTAVRVLLNSLHHPAPSNLPQFPPPDFTDLEGQIRWVGPPSLCQENELPFSTFHCAQLQCTPHYANFSQLGLMHVTGSTVVPSSNYQLTTLSFTCEGDEANCVAESGVRAINTARWGDVVEPFQATQGQLNQPNIEDIAAIVDKFKGVSGAPIVAQTDLQPGTPDLRANIADVASAVDGFKFFAYPFTQAKGCLPASPH